MENNISVSQQNSIKKASFRDFEKLDIEVLSNSSLIFEKRSANASDVSPDVKYREDVKFYTQEMVRLIQLDGFDDGEVGLIHKLFDSLAIDNNRLFKESFQSAWLSLTRRQSYDLLYNFICAASTVEYHLFENEADCLLFAALALKNEDLNDAAIRAIESWEQKRHLSMLKDIRPFESQWLEDYRLEIINYLEVKNG